MSKTQMAVRFPAEVNKKIKIAQAKKMIETGKKCTLESIVIETIDNSL